MADQIYRHISKEFPEFVQLNNLLSLASMTFPLYGISAKDLSEMDDYHLKLIRLITNDR